MTKDDVRNLIRALERTDLPLDEWHHDAHLAMAVWYLSYLPRPQALRVISERIADYNARSADTPTPLRYHETVTLFLARGVGAFLDALPEEVEFEDRLRHVRAAFRDYKLLIRQYYSAPTIESATARGRWVPPDRLSMTAWLAACAEMATAAANPRDAKLAAAS